MQIHNARTGFNQTVITIGIADRLIVMNKGGSVKNQLFWRFKNLQEFTKNLKGQEGSVSGSIRMGRDVESA